MSCVHIYCDGGSRSNPGDAGAGIVAFEILAGDQQRCILEKAVYLQDKSNNYAEYYALLTALGYALLTDYKDIHVFSDSKLIIEQMNGVWKCKSEDLRPLWKMARGRVNELRASGVHVTLKWKPREQNQHADQLANLAMDRKANAEYRHNYRLEQQLTEIFNAMLRHEEVLRDLEISPKRSKIAEARSSFHAVTKAWAELKV